MPARAIFSGYPADATIPDRVSRNNTYQNRGINDVYKNLPRTATDNPEKPAFSERSKIVVA